jgi:DNA polymerase
MRIIVLDFETYFDRQTYTLNKMTTEEYIRDPRFEALCVSIVHQGKGVAIQQEHLKPFFANYDWSETAVVAHHAQFDGLILSHHFGIKPKFWFDTISMARIVYGPHQRVSLAALLKLHGMDPKTIDYGEQSGKRWHQMGERTRKMMLDGAVHDSVQTEKLFYMMLPKVPKIELELIDRTVRAFTEPRAVGDLQALRKVCLDEVNKKEDMLSELRVERSDLQSAATFQKLLEAEGVEVEFKYTKTIDKKTGEFRKAPAFAKTDGFMQELLESDFPRIRALAEARLGFKSVLNETRSGRMLRMAERGDMCIYMHHAGTHTLRVTGGDSMNWINLPRGGMIRKSICAPKGYKLSVKDYSGFELRLALKIAGQEDKLQHLANGGDIYCDFGTILYERTITKADEVERYISKQVVLGSQYRQGKTKLHGELNFKHKVPVDEDFCERAVKVYRYEEYPMIGGKQGVWKQLDKLIPLLATHETFEWKCFTFKYGRCYLPNGCYMFFENLEFRENKHTIGGGSWFFEKKKGRWVNFHGGIFFENLIQFLQRCVAAEAFVKMPRELQVILWPYDEFVNVVPESEAESAHRELIRIMKKEISWLPGLPIAVEGGVYDRYEK